MRELARRHGGYPFGPTACFPAGGQIISSAGGSAMQRERWMLAAIFSLWLFVLPGAVTAVEVGDKAPDFELPSTQGGKLRLSSLAGKQSVVIEFYVLDFTPG